METLLVFKKVYSKDLEYIDVIHGQILYCIDTLETFYDNKDLYRINITVNAMYLETETEKNNIYSPLINRVYMIGENSKLYWYLDDVWYPMTTEKQLYDIITDLNDLTPYILADDENFLAPRTIASAVYMEDGTRLSTVMKNPNILTITKTKAVYVEVIKDNQRIFTIPYPVSDYDLARNHISFIVRGNLYEPNRYVINNDRLILNTTNSTLRKGETVLFIFYYTIALDLNDNVVLNTKNYADKSITSEKIADSFRLEATKVIETVERIFMTPEEREKLRGVAYNATCYHHPDTHPATMIVEDEEHRFVTDIQIYNWNHKANADEVYTKEETDKIVKNLIGLAPEGLDTFKEIADAIGNDPNFATTMIEKLSLKADKTEITDLYKALEEKVDMDDYIRGCVYNTATLNRNVEGDFYNITLNDPLLKEYIDGMNVVIKIKDANTTTSFLQINTLGYRKIVTQEQYDLIRGELIPDSIYTLRYNGTTGNFILQGKGGVKINHSALKNYAVYGNEKIERGHIVDIVEETKVRHALPKIDLLATSYSDATKHYCDSDLRIQYLDKSRVLVSWIDNESLKLQVFKVDIISGKIIFNNLESPLILNQECRNYSVGVINANRIVVSYSTKIKTFHTMPININETEFTTGTPIDIEDINYTDICKVVPIGLERVIVTWKVAELTKCMYLSTIDGHNLTKISERTNLNYPIDEMIKINDKQIVFIGNSSNVISAWVMNVDAADFYNNTLINTYVSTTEERFDNLMVTYIENNMVSIFFTDVEKTKQYRQNITIKENGGIIKEDPKQIAYGDIGKDMVYKYKMYESGLYLTTNNQGGLHVLLNNIDNKSITNIDKNIALFNMKYRLIDFDLINNQLILVYSSNLDNGENDYLFFSIYRVERQPNGVAMSSGIVNQVIPVSIWN